MIDTIISIKLLLVLIAGILVLDEIFLGLQTAETANFFASRAALVDENVHQVDQFFNDHIFQNLIYTKNNPWVRIAPLGTKQNHQTSQLVTTFQVQSYVDSKELRPFQQNGYSKSSSIGVIRP